MNDNKTICQSIPHSVKYHTQTRMHAFMFTDVTISPRNGKQVHVHLYIQFSNHQTHWNEKSRGHAIKRMGVIEQESQTDSQTERKEHRLEFITRA